MYTLDEMKKLAAKGKMSRRDFVQMAVAAGATVGMAETMFNSARASEPQRGGHLRMGLRHGNTSDTLNPWYYPDSSTQVMFWGTFRTASPRSTPTAISCSTSSRRSIPVTTRRGR